MNGKSCVFYFSSNYYRRNFIDTWEEEIKRFNAAASKIYKDKFDLEMDVLAMIRLYALIEKRGFYLTIDGEEITCPEDLRYVLVLTTKKNSQS
jgi:hypothetical protein